MDDPVGVERVVARVRNRELWAHVNASFTDADANRRWRDEQVRWGLFGRPEADLGVLGPLAGLDVVELGCGTAFLSAGIARAGGRPVGVDLSGAQLGTARTMQARHHLAFPLVEADATDVPLRSGSFDLVVSEYGAAPWCEPGRWLAEAHRLLRPEGRLVFLTNSPLVAMCVPAEGGAAGERLLRGAFGTDAVAWPDGGVEHHPGHGDWVRELGAAGFVVDALHELHAPPGAADPDWYDIVSPEWAARWPAEDLWVAHRAT